VRKLVAVLALAAVSAIGACKKTGEGEYQVKTPDVDVKTDTTTIQTPSVDAGMKKDTLIVDRPTVDVKTPSERKGETTGTKKRP
jgi:hypothetical protein